ncbi:MAG: TetR/AcrR family transcriptional regulator [Acidimicrobiales bacterium]
MVPIRQSADVRRASVLDAAIIEFARSGYAGTSTDAIATRAGISQPYLFRLFGTKKDLFIATYAVVSDRIEQAFVAAAEDLVGEDAMKAIGLAYTELLSDPDLLQVQLHGFVAAAADPDIAAACQDTFRRLWRLVEAATHVTPEELRQFFAQGMLCSVMAAIDLRSVEEPWARHFFDVEEESKRKALEAMGGERHAPASSLI